MNILITGGSKSGKSTYAENLALRLAQGQPIHYLATMKAIGAEDFAVVARHRKQREGKNFLVLEQQKDIGALCFPPGSTLLLEDLPNLLANEMFDHGLIDRIFPALASLSSTLKHLIIITNEVGADGNQYDAYTERYIDALGRLNCQAAAMCDRVIEVVYSLPLPLKGELP